MTPSTDPTMTTVLTRVLTLLTFLAPIGATAAQQTQSDDYTRYELLAPESGKFRILYEVTATTPGATHFFNAIRRGSVATDERVVDLMTGAALPFSVVGGAVARTGGMRNADTTGEYIRVTLARPVPQEGEGRILIDKTYYDPQSYRIDNGVLVFTRSLGIKRNAVVLPAGYQLISSNFPAQILEEADGRIAVSFWNNTPAAADLTIRARKAAAPARPATSSATPPDRRTRLAERAHQTREIVYSLRDPATGAFDLYHDYTETRPGTTTYLNVVRAGSTVANPRARLLDTGEELKWEVVRGEAIRRAGLQVADVTPQTEVVVFRFPAVPQGGSYRVRMYETYTDTARYRLVGDELIWDRSFGRPANAVILPAGWTLTNSAIPAVVTETADGRTRLDFVNPRPDEIATLITARRR
jgi:hypothetical protein